MAKPVIFPIIAMLGAAIYSHHFAIDTDHLAGVSLPLFQA
jgi:hypothetical protein